jgi:cobalt-zinc-cadmium efflux system membrane fusion protein
VNRAHITLPLILLGCLALGACSSKEEATKAAAPAPATPAPANDPMSIVADAEVGKWLKVAPVQTVEYRETIRVPASASVDETRVARIGASVTGRITELRAIVGQNVTRGQVLAALNSTELSNAQLSFLKAYSAKLLAQRAAERAQQLFDADVIGLAELQRRQTELAQAEADMSASHDQLKVLGMAEASIEKLESTRTVNSQSFVVSSISGTVIDRIVAQGQVVQPGAAVFTVADLSRLWVQAEVPEKQSDLVKVGDVVKVAIPALENRTIEGRLVFVSSTVNPETRTVTVRTEVANTDRSIRPAMLAVMMIEDRPTMRPVVPVDAVVRENNKDYVFTRVADNRYKLVTVALGPESNGVRPVVDGLKDGESIVADGAFHLNNERKQNLQ